MAHALKKNWKDAKKKKAVCPFTWKQQKEKLEKIKKERKIEKEKIDILKQKKREYKSAMKKKRELAQNKNN